MFRIPPMISFREIRLNQAQRTQAKIHFEVQISSLVPTCSMDQAKRIVKEAANILQATRVIRLGRVQLKATAILSLHPSQVFPISPSKETLRYFSDEFHECLINLSQDSRHCS